MKKPNIGKNKKILFYIDCMQMGGANRVMANLVDYFDTKEYEVSASVDRVYLKNSDNRLLKNYIRMRELRSIIKSEKPDTVVSFMGPPNIRLLLSTIGLNTKKIVSVRNDPYFEYGKGIRKIVVNILFLLADGCVFQTDEAKQYFLNRIKNKSIIIYNPVNEKFYKTKRVDIKKEIVVIGRLQKQKNPMIAVKAFARVANDYPDYKLVFYGDGELRSEIESFSKDKGLSDRIVIKGRVDDVELRLSQAAIYILCSDFEGMPNALMEAMAVGVPAISTDCPCGGPRTLIGKENQGILVPCGDDNAISNAISDILNSKSLQEEMSKSERERAKDFVPQKILKAWESYLC